MIVGNVAAFPISVEIVDLFDLDFNLGNEGDRSRGIDFIHGDSREQSAEVLKHAQAKSTLMTMRMAEGQLKSWTSLITTLDDLCDATLMSRSSDGHRPTTNFYLTNRLLICTSNKKKFNLLETLQSSSKFLVHLSKFVLLTLFIKDIRSLSLLLPIPSLTPVFVVETKQQHLVKVRKKGLYKKRKKVGCQTISRLSITCPTCVNCLFRCKTSSFA